MYGGKSTVTLTTRFFYFYDFYCIQFIRGRRRLPF